VTRGTRLLINNFSGEVTVRAWDRDSVRVQARHAMSQRLGLPCGGVQYQGHDMRQRRAHNAGVPARGELGEFHGAAVSTGVCARS